MASRFSGVIARGRGFQLSFSYEGKRCREMVLLPQNSKGQQQAADYLGLVRSEICFGTFDYSKRFPKSRQRFSVSSLVGNIEQELNSWMRINEKLLAKSTRIDYQGKINKHLIPNFGEIVLGKLTRMQIQEWVSTASIGAKSIRNILCPLRSCYRDAESDGRIDNNPFRNLRLPTVQTRELEPFSEVEQSKILKALSPELRLYFEFAFETGIRTSEQIALIWSDVEFPEGVIHIKRAKVRGSTKPPKTKAGIRTIPLSIAAKEVLARQSKLSRNGATIFLDPLHQKPWKDDKALRMSHWYPALKQAGVKKREPYQTRHTFASINLSRGSMSPIELLKLMGHSNLSSIYNNYAKWIPASGNTRNM